MNAPAIAPGTPVLLPTGVVIHVAEMRAGRKTGLVIKEGPWTGWRHSFKVRRDDVTVLEGPVLSPEMMARLLGLPE